MMYDPCACCWGPNMSGEVMIEQPAGAGEIIDAPGPDPAGPLPAPPPPLPPLGTDPLPSLDDPVPGDEGLVPDLGDSSYNAYQPLIRPATFQTPAYEGAPVLQRIPQAK